MYADKKLLKIGGKKRGINKATTLEVSNGRGLDIVNLLIYYTSHFCHVLYGYHWMFYYIVYLMLS